MATENDAIGFDQYSHIMQLLDLNPALVAVSSDERVASTSVFIFPFEDIEIETLGPTMIDRFKAVGRSKILDLIGTMLALLSVVLVTVSRSLPPRVLFLSLLS